MLCVFFFLTSTKKMEGGNQAAIPDRWEFPKGVALKGSDALQGGSGSGTAWQCLRLPLPPSSKTGWFPDVSSKQNLPPCLWNPFNKH